MTSTPPSTLTKDVPPDGQAPDDSSKLRTFVSILKNFIGVTDIAAVRFSLPAQLLEPIPNLEYWNYLDRPEYFAAIGDSDDDLERMLACLRFWFTKDLKYVHGKPCKPYNSALGEFFRCQWEVTESAVPTSQETENEPNGMAAATTAEASTNGVTKSVRVNYLTEQTSHHPPVSAFYAECPDKNISMRGYDQLSAKFLGTSIRVTPGNFNEGIFITLHGRGDEEYQLTHPTAYLGGFIRGNLSVTVADSCTITCPKTGLTVLLNYVGESYFGKTQNKVEGVIYKSEGESSTYDAIKDVPDKVVLARINGSWKDKIYLSNGSTDFKKVADKDRILFIDVNALRPLPKICPPEDAQLPNESQRFWRDVTNNITNKQFSSATTAKQELEERQRARAAERKKEGKDWTPCFFTGSTEPKGKPELTEHGRKAMQGLQAQQWQLDQPAEFGAF